MCQRWTRGHKARGQGRRQGHTKSEAKPRTNFLKTDPLEAKDRYTRGLGPRTQASKKFFFNSKKKSFQKFFSGDLRKKKQKKVFANFPQGFWRFPTKF